MNMLRSRYGLSLVELLGILAALTVVINLSATLFLSGMRLHASAQNRLESLAAEQRLHDSVTSSIRAAEAILPALDAYATGDSQLVLRMPESGPDPEYHVIGALGDTPVFGVAVFRGDGATLELVKTTALSQDPSRFQFTYDHEDPRRARLVTLRWKDPGSPSGPWTAEARAALRPWSASHASN